MEKAQDILAAIHRTKTTRDKSRMMYKSVFWSAVEDTLAQSFILAPQLKIIAQKTMPRIYLKCGFNQNTSRGFFQGPRELGGSGFIPLHATASTGHVLQFLKHWRTPEECRQTPK